MLAYPQAFFDLNLRFAHKVFELSEQLFESTLLHYTNLYIRFGLGRDFDPANTVWQAYLAGLQNSADQSRWTYDFYRAQMAATSIAPVDWPFGCFSYTIEENHCIRLHFHNNEGSAHSPLSHERMDLRLAELATMFAHLKATAGEAGAVIGASWLYNLAAYRRLFPLAYLATAQASDDDFPYLPLWGQFVNHRGEMKTALVVEFLDRLERQQTLAGIIRCFPYRVLRLESPVQEFYAFYRVK